MRSFVVIILIVCYATAMALISNHRIGGCFAQALISMGLILYVSQFLSGSFQPGYNVICTIATAAIPIGIIFRKRIKDTVLTRGLVCFLTAAVLFFFLDYHRAFSTWDELSHWGMMTKEMLRLDTWYSAPGSRLLVHQDYPPFLSLIEMMWCHFAGGYSETCVYLALHVFSISMITPSLVDSDSMSLRTGKQKGWLNSFLGLLLLNVLFITIIEVFDPEHIFFTIYKDIGVSLIFVYGAMLIVDQSALNNWFSFSSLVMACAGLLLTKQIGMAFALILWFLYAIAFLYEKRHAYHGWLQYLAVFIMHAALLVLVPMAFQYFWQAYTDTLSLEPQFSTSKISIAEILKIFQDPYGETLRRQTFNAFIHGLFEKNVTTSILPLPYAAGFLLVILVIWLLVKFQSISFTSSNAIQLVTAFTCGTLGYALTLCILYLFCFSESEMQQLASFERYMSSYLLAEFMILFCILYKLLNEKKKMGPKQLFACFVACAVLTNASNLNSFVPGALDGIPNCHERQIAAEIDAWVPGDDSVFILSGNTILTQYYVNYYCNEASIPLEYTNLLAIDLSDPATLQKWKDVAFGYDYLYIDEVNDVFNVAYADLNGGMLFQTGALYKVNKNKTVTRVDRDEDLYHETNLSNYLRKLSDRDDTVFISVMGDASDLLTNEVKSELKNIGISSDLDVQYGASFYAVLENHKSIAEEAGSSSLMQEGALSNDSVYSITSAGYNSSNSSSIKINGEEYAIGLEGMNIVVYDEARKCVVDSVVFDMNGNASRGEKTLASFLEETASN